jgi:hypothetical protein
MNIGIQDDIFCTLSTFQHFKVSTLFDHSAISLRLTPAGLAKRSSLSRYRSIAPKLHPGLRTLNSHTHKLAHIRKGPNNVQPPHISFHRSRNNASRRLTSYGLRFTLLQPKL